MVNDHLAVAVRESPVRQVWIGFTLIRILRTSDFVVFWTNVFDWIGQAQDGWQYAFQGGGAASVPASNPANEQRDRKTRDMTYSLQVAAIELILMAALFWQTQIQRPSP